MFGLSLQSWMFLVLCCFVFSLISGSAIILLFGHHGMKIALTIGAIALVVLAVFVCGFTVPTFFVGALMLVLLKWNHII
jgi:hypothetical protein